MSNPEIQDSGEPIEYRCLICRDSRFVHPVKEGVPDYGDLVPCQCVKDTLAVERSQRMLRWCELPAASEHMTLENFKASTQTKEALEAARAIAEEQEGAGWLTLVGATDRGKSHLAIAICRRWLERGRLARYAYVPLLLDELRRGFHEGGDGSYESRFDMFLKVPLLILDDLGTENPTPWVQERLDVIVNFRLINGLALVVTSNLSLPELPPRIASRLNRGGRIVTIGGPAYSTGRRKSHGA